MHKKSIKEIKSYYSSSKVVGSYDSRRFRGLGGNYINQKETKPILDFLKSIPSKKKLKIIDLGAGRGRLSKPLIENGYDVYCLDSSPEMIKELSTIVNREKIIAQSVFDPIKTENKFNIVTSLRFFDHFSLNEQEKIIQNVGKNLENGGYLVLSCLNKNSLESLLSRLFSYGKFNYFYTNEQYRNILKKNNWEVINLKGNFILPRGVFLYTGFSSFLTRILINIDSFLSSLFPFYSANFVYLIRKSETKKKKIIFLENMIYPLRNKFFNLLNQKGKYNFKVFFLTDTSKNRKWNVGEEKIEFPYRILKNCRFSLPDIDVFEYAFNPFVISDYFSEEKDAIISIGWANLANMIFMFLALITKKPYYIWCESTINEKTTLRQITKPLVSFFIKYAQGCIVPGEMAKKYIHSFSQKVPTYIIPNAVDNDIFAKVKIRKGNGKKVKILFIGRFEIVKDLPTLLSACEVINQKYPHLFDLTLVGYGTQEEKLKKIVSSRKLDFVKIQGYVPREKLPKVYKTHDIFVLPSIREVWGFVVNEAMASGLPIIISNKIGCGSDLVKPDRNGYIFESSNALDLAKYLEKLILDRKLREKMGEESLKIIQNYTYEEKVKKFNQFIKI